MKEVGLRSPRDVNDVQPLTLRHPTTQYHSQEQSKGLLFPRTQAGMKALGSEA